MRVDRTRSIPVRLILLPCSFCHCAFFHVSSLLVQIHLMCMDFSLLLTLRDLIGKELDHVVTGYFHNITSSTDMPAGSKTIHSDYWSILRICLIHTPDYYRAWLAVDSSPVSQIQQLGVIYLAASGNCLCAPGMVRYNLLCELRADHIAHHV